MKRLNAAQLRKTKPTKKELAQIKRNPIILVLDRIIDTYNTGSLFRLADAIAAEEVYLCGKMEYPPSSRIHKAAVGTEEWVPWEKTSSTVRTVRLLKSRGVQIIAVEQDPRSIAYTDLGGASSAYSIHFPCAIVVGAETGGMEKEVLDEANIIVEIPMFGVNKSFNVWGSAAIIAYKALESLTS